MRLFRFFRMVGLAEGISFLLLVGVAMPLKYLANRPEAVLVFGWMHGVLFVAYCLLLARVYLSFRWSFSKALLAFGAALFPLGTFLLDKNLKKEEKKLFTRQNA